MHRLMVTSADVSPVVARRPGQPAGRARRWSSTARTACCGTRGGAGWRAKRSATSCCNWPASSTSGCSAQSAGPSCPPGIDPNWPGSPTHDPQDRDRRSVYVLAKRNLRYPLLDVFDLPDMHNSCPQRPAHHHGPAGPGTDERRVRARAGPRAGAAGCWRTRRDTAALVRAALARSAGSTRPVDDELAASRSVSSTRANRANRSPRATRPPATRCPSPCRRPRPGPAAAVVDFCHALLNSNELLYVD